MSQKRGKIESNPFGITQSDTTSQDEIYGGWDNNTQEEEEFNKLTGNQSSNSGADFFQAADNNSTGPSSQNNYFRNQESQNKNKQQNQSLFDMQGMIDMNEDTSSSTYYNNEANQYNEENEPPLLEDLGINVELIKSRMLSVIKLKKCDEKFLVESDMSGPILLGFVMGCLMMLAGKIHFGYIYGFGICGTVCLYLILNWLAQSRNIELYNVLSILGYCLVPIVILSFFAVFINLIGIFGGILSIIAILWATYMASTFFEEVLHLSHQKYLAAYPIFLFYFTFVLITIF